MSSVRLDFYNRNSPRHYRLALTQQALSSGCSVEIVGVNGRRVSLVDVQLETTAPVTVEVARANPNSSGTKSATSPSALRPGDSSYSGTVNLYSVASSSDVTLADLGSFTLSTGLGGDVFTFRPYVAGSSEALVLKLSDGVTITAGHLEFIEEP